MLFNDVILVFCIVEICGDVLDEFFCVVYSFLEFVNEGIYGDIGGFLYFIIYCEIN